MRAAARGWHLARWFILLAISGVTIVLDPVRAPLWVGLALAGTVRPCYLAWRAAAGTALRGALVWSALAIVLGLLAQLRPGWKLSRRGGPGPAGLPT